MNNNLSTKLNIVEDNINTMKNNWGLNETDPIESLTETAQLKLQDRTIEITKNGTQIITFDEEYNGLNKVEVVTNTDNYKITDGSYLFYKGIRKDGMNEILSLCDLTNCEYMFGYYNSSLDTNNINLNTNNVTSMRYMFSNTSAYSIDLGGLNTSSVTDMSYMFYTNRTLQEISNLNKLNTSNVTNMESMFYCCDHMGLQSLDLSSFDTSSVTNMKNMFYQAKGLKTLDLSHFNTEKVTNIEGMFYACGYLESLNVSNFNTSNVTSLANLFSGCSNLVTLDLSSFDTSKVKNMNLLFYGCTKLEFLDMRNFDLTNVTSYYNTFGSLPADCKIIVKDDTTRDLILAQRSSLTNIVTVAEYEAEQ